MNRHVSDPVLRIRALAERFPIETGLSGAIRKLGDAHMLIYESASSRQVRVVVDQATQYMESAAKGYYELAAAAVIVGANAKSDSYLSELGHVGTFSLNEAETIRYLSGLLRGRGQSDVDYRVVTHRERLEESLQGLRRISSGAPATIL